MYNLLLYILKVLTGINFQIVILKRLGRLYSIFVLICFRLGFDDDVSIMFYIFR